MYGARGGERLLAGSPLADWGASGRGPVDYDQPDLWSTAAGVVTLERGTLVVRGGPGRGRRIALPSGVRAASAAGGLAAVATDAEVSVLDLSGPCLRTEVSVRTDQPEGGASVPRSAARRRRHRTAA